MSGTSAPATTTTSSKPKVTLVQRSDGQVKLVRIDGNEFPVLSAGPALINGKLGVSITMDDIELSCEAAPADTQSDKS